MRAAAILGLGCSPKNLEPFQTDSNVAWKLGLPTGPEDADVVLIFGGDGTIHRHLGQLVKLKLPVLVVPAGSGNDFASSLGLKRVRYSLTAWRAFTNSPTNVREIDLGIIAALGQETSEGAEKSGRYFCCVAGVGIDGEVARRANQLPRWLRGNGGYVLSMIPTIFSFPPFSMKVSTSETKDQWTARSDQPTLVAAFANTPLYGGGMKVAPRAKMDDGQLDICIVGGVNPFRLFYLFPTVFTGRHLQVKEVSYFSASNVRAETEFPLDVYADGEYVCKTPVEVSIERAALKVIVPAL